MKPAEIHAKWKLLQDKIASEFDSDVPDLKVILFLIGVQELGKGPGKYSKRQKEELMHIATCRLLSEMGFYELELRSRWLASLEVGKAGSFLCINGTRAFA
jgi:hypothetical protein